MTYEPETSGDRRARVEAEEREARIATPGYIAEVQAKIDGGKLGVDEIKSLLGDMAAANPRYLDPDNQH